jgi:hypothetical protein
MDRGIDIRNLGTVENFMVLENVESLYKFLFHNLINFVTKSIT